MLRRRKKPKDLPESLHKLYGRLEARGKEPVLPASWDYDFLGLDRSLFAMHDDENAVLTSIRCLSDTEVSHFRGKMAFERCSWSVRAYAQSWR